jgi:hypothetical protein
MVTLFRFANLIPARRLLEPAHAKLRPDVDIGCKCRSKRRMRITRASDSIKKRSALDFTQRSNRLRAQKRIVQRFPSMRALGQLLADVDRDHDLACDVI